MRTLSGKTQAAKDGAPWNCHACDNQSHPKPKDSPLRLVPPSLCLLQVAEITRASPLCNPYIIHHHLASPQPNLEHHKTSPERTQPHASNNCARPGSRSLHLPSWILAKVLCCIAIFSSFPFMYIIVLVSVEVAYAPDTIRRSSVHYMR